MNIIFEGIDGVGKSTLIESLKLDLDKKTIKSVIVKEIEDSPLKEVLEKMLKTDEFFKLNLDFKTSIFESFLLAADFFYKQELLKNEDKVIKLYDRDVFTVLCYQEIILEKEYGDEISKFFENFKKCLLFDLKKIDLLIYITMPLENIFERIEKRDKRKLNKKEKYFLEEVKNKFENEIIPEFKNKKINILELDGLKELKLKINIIKEKIKYEKV